MEKSSNNPGKFNDISEESDKTLDILWKFLCQGILTNVTFYCDIWFSLKWTTTISDTSPAWLKTIDSFKTILVMWFSP